MGGLTLLEYLTFKLPLVGKTVLRPIEIGLADAAFGPQVARCSNDQREYYFDLASSQC